MPILAKIQRRNGIKRDKYLQNCPQIRSPASCREEKQATINLKSQPRPLLPYFANVCLKTD